MFKLMLLLAQTATPTSGPTAGGGGPASIFQSPLIPLIIIIVVFWWVMSRGQRKKQQQYAQMLAALKRNDRVQTVGGIIGTVVDVRDDEVVLKVDETNNVKVRFARSAIKEVLREPGAGETTS
jgi:preprotein translocase subunit YajC